MHSGDFLLYLFMNFLITPKSENIRKLLKLIAYLYMYNLILF